jgi:hypothetical protein
MVGMKAVPVWIQEILGDLYVAIFTWRSFSAHAKHSSGMGLTPQEALSLQAWPGSRSAKSMAEIAEKPQIIGVS